MVRNPLAALGRMILAELPLGLEPRDFDAKSHDLLQQLFVVAGRRVGLPRPGHRLLVEGNIISHDLHHGLFVVDDLASSRRMHGQVIPGRDHVGLLVPARRDIGVGPVEDRQHFGPRHLPPVRIRAGHVPDELAVRADVAPQKQRQVRRAKLAASARDDQPKAVTLDEVENRRLLGALEIIGYIHAGTRRWRKSGQVGSWTVTPNFRFVRRLASSGGAASITISVGRNQKARRAFHRNSSARTTGAGDSGSMNRVLRTIRIESTRLRSRTRPGELEDAADPGRADRPGLDHFVLQHDDRESDHRRASARRHERRSGNCHGAAKPPPKWRPSTAA